MIRKVSKKVKSAPFEIVELQDASMSLDNWISVLLRLKVQFGGSKILSTDAGYNNVSFVLMENSDG